MIPVIGLASGLGGSHQGSHFGPLLLQKEFSANVDWQKVFQPDAEFFNKNGQILVLNQKLAQETYLSVLKNPFTLVIGGDHSCAIGTWSGVSEAVHKQGSELGIIWIDAHMDSHTPETTPSGNIHGMPLATLLGYGHKDFTQILSDRPKLKPENVFLIGIRSYEPEEKEFLEKLNIRVYYIEEVHQRGLNTILKEIANYFLEKSISYGITLDIDFFDADLMSATGTPAENGVHPSEFINHYNCLDCYPPIVFEYVEFNPPCDTNNQSLEWSIQILNCICSLWQVSLNKELIETK